MDWNALAQDRDSWRTLEKSVLNIRHKMRRSSWLEKDLLDSQEGSMELIRYSGVTRNFFSGGVQQIQLRTEDRESGDLGAVAP
jgi:hypothetical protein